MTEQLSNKHRQRSDINFPREMSPTNTPQYFLSKHPTIHKSKKKNKKPEKQNLNSTCTPTEVRDLMISLKQNKKTFMEKFQEDKIKMNELGELL